MKIKDKARKRMEYSEMSKTELLPPPAVRPRKGAAIVKSVTREEIERYWRVKKIDEEEHLLAALKAAARIRARTLCEEDYKRFEESLIDVIKKANERKNGESNEEPRVGIKDWWTKSKYAYLNQPATKSGGEDGASRRATSTYVPLKACSCSPLSSHSVATSLGVF